MSEDTPPYKPKIIPLRGSDNTPEVVLHRTLLKVDRIKAVTIMIEWDNGDHDVDWSIQDISELAATSKMLDYYAMVEIERAIKSDMND
jgi:hypothetical protein